MATRVGSVRTWQSTNAELPREDPDQQSEEKAVRGASAFDDKMHLQRLGEVAQRRRRFLALVLRQPR